MPEEAGPTAGISRQDLIADRALRPNDPDEFEYSPLADRIADLCTSAEAPVNIALFSPWGSGKSSLSTLIDERLQRQGGGVRLIRYDAWRYGGDGLRRNFIAHAARELHIPLDDPQYAEFHRGLYENQRRVSLHGTRLWVALRSSRLTPWAVAALLIALAAWIVGLNSVLLGAIVSTLLLFITAIVDTGKVEVEQSKPSEDEEFFARFSRLVAWATDTSTRPEGARFRFGGLWQSLCISLADGLGIYRLRLWWSAQIPADELTRTPLTRLVFFIDELDRCSRSDIAKTLKALRTFLDARNCAFIVAADRQVIEEALSELEQSTPIEPEAPYYSTAGAYLDKIFQHQLSLPPLRGRRLTGYARDLVEKQIERAGNSDCFWSDLAADSEGETLDETLYALIPSHVRSPRRVKVLLNNFLVAAKLAQARDIYSIDRSPEVAKLVALRTEFPLFAADLYLEPRLPTYFIGAEEAPDHRKDAVAALVNKQRDGEFISDFDEDGNSSVKVDQDTIDRHREELRRYLQRTSEITDPRRDLLYLEPPGKIYGLDPELGERIERDAPDVPEEVLNELLHAEGTTQTSATRLLADLVESLHGPERFRAMTVLMGLAGAVEPVSSIASIVGRALNSFRRAEDLGQEHLVGAVRIALEVESGWNTPRPLVTRLFADQRLLAEPDRVAALAGMTPRLMTTELKQVQAAIGTFVTANPWVLLNPLAVLDDEAASRLVWIDSIWAGVAAYVSQDPQPQASDFLDQLQLSGLNDPKRPKLAVAIQARLLDQDNGLAYQVVNEHADAVIEIDDEPELGRSRILQAWAQAPPEHWEVWSERYAR